MGQIILQEEIIEGGYFSFPLLVYIRTWEGVNLDGSGDISSLTDLTGNGNDFTARGTTNPELVINGINGVQSARIDGFNGFECLTGLGVPNLDNHVVWIVFQLETLTGQTYHNVFLFGDTYTNAGGYSQLYNTASGSTVFRSQRPSGSQLTKTGVQLDKHYGIVKYDGVNASFSLDGSTYVTTPYINSVVSNGQFIGQWNSRGAKMLFSEMGIVEDSSVFGAPEKAELEAYLLNKYGI